MAPDSNTAMGSFHSETCPCGQAKRPRRPFCEQCHHRLGSTEKANLAASPGYGYEQALDRSLRRLGITEPVWAIPGPLVARGKHPTKTGGGALGSFRRGFAPSPLREEQQKAVVFVCAAWKGGRDG